MQITYSLIYWILDETFTSESHLMIYFWSECGVILEMNQNILQKEITLTLTFLTNRRIIWNSFQNFWLTLAFNYHSGRGVTPPFGQRDQIIKWNVRFNMHSKISMEYINKNLMNTNRVYSRKFIQKFFWSHNLHFWIMEIF